MRLTQHRPTGPVALAMTAATIATMLALVSLPASAMASEPNYELFGDASLVHPGYESNTAVQASYDGCIPTALNEYCQTNSGRMAVSHSPCLRA